jgi:hypothetical protein
MTLSEAQLQNFHKAVKEFSNDRTVVLAIPGTIRNAGRNVDIVQVTIGHNPTRKTYKYMYRGISSNFRDWLKKKVDEINNK